MTATFWIETVQLDLQVPVMAAGDSITLTPTTTVQGLPLPQFAVQALNAINSPKTVQASYQQIQYSQAVMLVFNTLTWPHVSVATLVPANPIPVTVQ